MWMPIRVWWYRQFIKHDKWPDDVRIYLFRRGVRTLEEIKDRLSPEEQEELANEELAAVLEDDSPLMDSMRDEVLTDAMGRLAQIPLDYCAKCGSPVFVHKARKVNGQYYCESCALDNKA